MNAPTTHRTKPRPDRASRSPVKTRAKKQEEDVPELKPENKHSLKVEEYPYEKGDDVWGEHIRDKDWWDHPRDHHHNHKVKVVTPKEYTARKQLIHKKYFMGGHYVSELW